MYSEFKFKNYFYTDSKAYSKYGPNICVKLTHFVRAVNQNYGSVTDESVDMIMGYICLLKIGH